MKYILALLLLFIVFELHAQQQPVSPASDLAKKQAQRMQDSLGLTNQQKQKLFAINMQLYQDKTKARMQNQGNMEEIRKAMQKLENTRDSLYKTVLPLEKHNQYLSRKKNLLSN